MQRLHWLPLQALLRHSIEFCSEKFVHHIIVKMCDVSTTGGYRSSIRLVSDCMVHHPLCNLSYFLYELQQCNCGSANRILSTCRSSISTTWNPLCINTLTYPLSGSHILNISYRIFSRACRKLKKRKWKEFLMRMENPSRRCDGRIIESSTGKLSLLVPGLGTASVGLAHGFL